MTDHKPDPFEIANEVAQEFPDVLALALQQDEAALGEWMARQSGGDLERIQRALDRIYAISSQEERNRRTTLQQDGTEPQTGEDL